MRGGWLRFYRLSLARAYCGKSSRSDLVIFGIVHVDVLPESNPKPEVQNRKPEMMGYENPDPIPECSNPTQYP